MVRLALPPNSLRELLVFSAAPIALLISASVSAQAPIPTRPGEPLPMVTVDVNNSATQRDDYVGQQFVRCRVRLAQPMQRDARVVLSNMTGATGRVAFRSPLVVWPILTSQLRLTLPRSGAWVSFQVRARAPSKIDKDAVIEVREDRPDGVVLGRKALATLGWLVTPLAAGPTVVVSVASPLTTVDDYLTWSPTRVTLRQVGGASALQVQVRNMPGSSDHLRFAPNQNPWPSGTTATQPTVSVTIPANGAVTVVAAGLFGSPSTRDKDAVIEVVSRYGRPIVREGLMVRVRKNANSLTTLERTSFLKALARLNYQADAYDRMQKTHHNALDEAHGLHAFLPWHRVFMLDLERMLQAMDPSVALHYWRFDQPAPNVFNTNFMGTTPAGTAAVFDASNPLSLWRVEDDNTPPGVITGITRKPMFLPAATPAVSDELTTLGLGDPGALYANFRPRMEGNPHGNAHVEGGGYVGLFICIGVLCDVTISPRDPLFFMLHSNVDRLWAKWQFTEARFDGTTPEAYPQQTDPGTSFFNCDGHRSYIDGEMWPWNGVTSATDPCRPSLTVGGPLAITPISMQSPPPKPRPRDVVDYRFAQLDIHGNGFAYDDVPHP